MEMQRVDDQGETQSNDLPTGTNTELEYNWSRTTRRYRARLRSLELFVKNNSRTATISFMKEYFCSGGWFEHFLPSDIKPNTYSAGFVSSKCLALAGVSGGLMFKITISGTSDIFYLIIGFANPVFGSYRTYINISDRALGAEDGFNQAEDNSHKIIEYGNFKAEAIVTNPDEGADKKMLFTVSDTN